MENRKCSHWKPGFIISVFLRLTFRKFRLKVLKDQKAFFLPNRYLNRSNYETCAIGSIFSKNDCNSYSDEMDDLQDAIEDAQYVNAISSAEDGPRPVLPWRLPTELELNNWKQNQLSRNLEGTLTPFEFEWTLSMALGFFFFSAYLKDVCNDYVEINFIEEIIRWKMSHGRRRADITATIILKYLTPLGPLVPSVTVEETVENKVEPKAKPAKTEIFEHDLAMQPIPSTPEKIQNLRARSFDASTDKSAVGLCGPVLQDILTTVDKLRHAPGFGALETKHNEHKKNGSDNGMIEKRNERKTLRHLSVVSNSLPEKLFDEAQLIILENIREKHWNGFQESPQYSKLLNFLWFRDQKVVEEDFFVMRVLGRGGFGLVTACKKGTSGKLYAMKVMNKKRIKIKKSEQLAINEQRALADLNSPFVVNLTYSFQSVSDVFLVLDLMTGGDLSFHLSQKGCFSTEQCLYYGARIMLGLKALHDRGYAYRDLKPENCLLGDDGRVKLTDLGLAIKVTSTLNGAAGTRGYWAPEMLRRDEKGKRMPYDHMVDWFSFGCCLAEFISGTNPFHSEEAINFGMQRKKKTKESAIDCAILEMHPVFESKHYNEDAADICRRLIDKNEKTRLGVHGCNEIMSHPWFRDVSWEDITSDRMRPPFIPPKNINAASQSEIGTFAEDKVFQDTVLSETDMELYEQWDYTSHKAFASEVIEFLIYERETGEPLLPIQLNNSCCCMIM